MTIMYLVGLFVLGAIFGSFGSVVLTRMRYKITWTTLKGFFVGRSKCPECKHILKRYDLIPLYSWFRNKGQCAYCDAKLSSMYPTLEIVSGVIFVLRGVVYLLPDLASYGAHDIVMLIARWLLGLLFVRDIYTYELHVPVRFALLVVELVYVIIALVQGHAEWSMLVLPAVFFTLFFVVYRLGKWYVKYRFGQNQEGFGQGDVMLAPLLGFLLALHGFTIGVAANLVLVFILGSSVIGIIYYALAWLIHRYRSTNSKRHSTGSAMIPFLPAMIVCYRVLVVIQLSKFWFF